MAAALCWAAAASPAAAQAPAWNLEAQQRLHGAPGADTQQALVERQRLLADGEARLAAGDAEAARRAFEQAALKEHAADIELALVRTSLQAGEYRQALAFAAHVAGAHADAAAASALYAWLLHLGGQPEVAKTLLATASQRWPDDPLVATVQAAIDRPGSPASSQKDSSSTNIAPYAHGAHVGQDARVAASAVLVADGRLALAPLAALDGVQRLWLRDGLGRTRRAEVIRQDPFLGLALLRADEAFGAAMGAPLAPRDAFAGSPAFAVGYAATPVAAPGWPLMKLGFLGMPVPNLPERQLGFEMPAGAAGGPVFDSGARLTGVVIEGPDGKTRFTALSKLLALWEPMAPDLPASAAPVRVSVDEIYERAMRLALQVIVAP